MHDAGSGLQRTEEVDRMVRRVAEKQRDRGALAVTGPHEGGSRGLDQRLKLAVADLPVAEFKHRARAELSGGIREQVRQRAARDLVAPLHALGIILFAGIGHGNVQHLLGGHRRVGSPPPCGEGLGKGVHAGNADAATPLPNPLPQGEREPEHRASSAKKDHAAFDAAASEAKVLPSSASFFSSGAGSSEGSLVSLA
ncbi:hypothetical protein ACVWW1_005751 [Bradyrhizobium sp. JR3.5]